MDAPSCLWQGDSGLGTRPKMHLRTVVRSTFGSGSLGLLGAPMSWAPIHTLTLGLLWAPISLPMGAVRVRVSAHAGARVLARSHKTGLRKVQRFLGCS